MHASRQALTRRAALFGLFARPAPANGTSSGTCGRATSTGSTVGLSSAVIIERHASGAPALAAQATPPPSARVAVVQGRACLAYRALTCSVCVERCPEEGALVREGGLPRVVSELCTGCGVCRDVCPAPRNAILLVERRPGVSR